jgi:hypothetical protein
MQTQPPAKGGCVALPRETILMAIAFATWLRRVAGAIVLISSFATWSLSAEPTQPEQLYEQLKKSEEHGNKLLAERWHKLVRQRQWVDASGKHRTYARYVDHDPNLQSVKLLVLVKKGDQQSFKEGSVALSRLSKNDQAAVKRIAMVRKQVEKALADSPLGTEGAIGEEGSREAMLTAGEGREEFTPPTADAAVDAAPPIDPSLPAWRRDFAAFAANLSVSADRESGQTALSWGELPQLEVVYGKERMLAGLRALPPEQQPVSAMMMLALQYQAALIALGEVHWEASLVGSGDPAGELQHDLQLPSPFTLSLIADPKYAVDVSQSSRGGPVRFIGRFAALGGFAESPQIKLFVRLPSDQLASQAIPVPQEVLLGAAPGASGGLAPSGPPTEIPGAGQPDASPYRR